MKIKPYGNGYRCEALLCLHGVPERRLPKCRPLGTEEQMQGLRYACVVDHKGACLDSKRLGCRN